MDKGRCYESLYVNFIICSWTIIARVMITHRPPSIIHPHHQRSSWTCACGRCLYPTISYIYLFIRGNDISNTFTVTRQSVTQPFTFGVLWSIYLSGIPTHAEVFHLICCSLNDQPTAWFFSLLMMRMTNSRPFYILRTRERKAAHAIPQKRNNYWWWSSSAKRTAHVQLHRRQGICVHMQMNCQWTIHTMWHLIFIHLLARIKWHGRRNLGNNVILREKSSSAFQPLNKEQSSLPIKFYYSCWRR